MPFFADVFSRRMFLQIHWMFHAGPVSAIRKGKLENLVKHMQEKSLACYYPGQDIGIDETTVAFKGRVAFRTYIPQKPNKWGVRVHDSANFLTGYVSVFEPYYGNETTQSLLTD